MRIGKRLFSIILSIMMLLTILPVGVYATGVPRYDSNVKGSITVDLKQLGFPTEGAKFQIHQVGTVKEEVHLRFETIGVFSGLGVDLNSLETVQETKDAIAIFMNELASQVPLADVEVMAGDEEVVFSDLEHGAYLITHSQQGGRGEVNPFMVYLPEMSETHDSWNHDMRAMPKGVFLTQTYEIRITKKVTLNGEPLNVSRSFYVTLFEDKALTRPIPNSTKELKLENSDTTTVEYTGLIENTTYYIAETDSAGNVLGTSGYEVDFDIAINNEEIELTPQNEQGEATITNDFKTAPPEISTSAYDKDDGDKTLACTDRVTVVDKVTYKNLIVGQEYLLKGVLMDKDTGEPLLINGEKVTAEKTFTAVLADGVVELEFNFSSLALPGKTLVVFEKLFYNNQEIAVHEDINDAEQTVMVESPPKITPTPTPTTPQATTTPRGDTITRPRAKTGDNNNVVLWVLGIAIPVGIIINMIFIKKRKRKKEETS